MARRVRFLIGITAAFGVVAVVAVAWAESAAEKPAIRFVIDKAEKLIAFEAVGLPQGRLSKLARLDSADEAFLQLFSVHVVTHLTSADIPAMAGAYTVDGSALRFTPRFPLCAGLKYRAVLCPAGTTASVTPDGADKPERGNAITRAVTIPEAAAGTPTEITQVFPSAGTLPENQLRFYLHFSASMSRGEAYECIHLLDSNGKRAEMPFLEIGEELWDARGRRFTLLVDPGRIKRGLKPREELGTVLEAGEEYTLVVDRTWRDAAGRSLKADFRKRFRAGPPVEVAIDPAAWKILPPPSGSNNSLIITFPRPLDRALVERTIKVAGAGGVPLAGQVAIADEERRWEFLPDLPWKAGKYQLVIDSTLEDVAGNRIGQAFEVSDKGPIENVESAKTVQIPFEIRS